MQLVLIVPCCGTQAGPVAAALWGGLNAGMAHRVQCWGDSAPHSELGVSHRVPREWLMDSLFFFSYTSCSPLIPNWRSFMPRAVTPPEAEAGKCSM